MRVFLTGATGTLGRPVVKLLLAEGHAVVGLARSHENELVLRNLGATHARADLFDRASMTSAVEGCDAVLHLATKIPPAKEARKKSAWAENDRIRSEGTRLLVDAALKTGTGTIVYPSICFLYIDNGDEWIDETTPVHAPPLLYSAVLAESEIERFSSEGGRGVVLRMGSFTGPDAPSTDEALEMARKGVAPLIGPDEAYMSRIDVADAASAVVAALDGAPSGVYNVVEDDPRTRGELLKDLAQAVGRKRLRKMPLWLVRLLAGRGALALARSQRVSNRHFKEATGWEPRSTSDLTLNT